MCPDYRAVDHLKTGVEERACRVEPDRARLQSQAGHHHHRHTGHDTGSHGLIRAANYAGAATEMLLSSHSSAGTEANPDFSALQSAATRKTLGATSTASFRTVCHRFLERWLSHDYSYRVPKTYRTAIRRSSRTLAGIGFAKDDRFWPKPSFCEPGLKTGMSQALPFRSNSSYRPSRQSAADAASNSTCFKPPKPGSGFWRRERIYPGAGTGRNALQPSRAYPGWHSSPAHTSQFA